MTTIKKQFEFEDAARGFAAGVEYIRSDLKVTVAPSKEGKHPSGLWDVSITGENGVFDITCDDKTPPDKWEDNSIQFPRLLAEIWGTGLTTRQVTFLCETMDLTLGQLDELFERADAVWQADKDNIFADIDARKHSRDRETHPDCSASISERGTRANGDSSSDAPGSEPTDGVPSDEGSGSTADVSVRNEGTISLFQLMSVAALTWVKVHLDGAMMIRGDVVVEHRYVELITKGMEADGLTVWHY